MAKKTKQAAKPPKKSTKKTRFDAKRKPKAAPKRPKNQRLPGMEIAKDRVLDGICESLHDIREALADMKANEKGAIQNGLRRMQQSGAALYKAHGIELARVPGDEKLRVRLVDSDEGDAGDSDGNDALEPEPSEPDADADLTGTEG